MLPKKPHDVQQEVERIKTIKGSVAAHAAEDNLYRAVLQTIANGQGEDYQNMAKHALKTQNIQFNRGYQENV